jgi:hypothetical protein
MAGQLKIDSINADSNLALKIANTAVAFIDSNGLRPVSGNLSLDSTGTTGIRLPAANTLAFHTAGTEDMRIDSDGNVGIGTSSPNNILEASRNQNSETQVRVYNANAGSSARAVYVLGNDSNSGAAGIHLNSSTNTGFGGGANSLNVYMGLSAPIAFLTNAAERMRIDSSGNLLVGTTSEQRSGTTRTPRITAYNTAAEGLNTVISDNTYAGWVHTSLDGGTGTHYCAYFENVVGTGVGQITHNGTNTSYTTSSDYRLKQNIAPMTGALAKVSQLKPCTYTWKESGLNSQGFIAHELQEVFPDAVTGEKDAVDENGNIKPQGVDTSFLVATLTAAIQELNAKVDAQAVEIAALKASQN